jgi:Domain of unknown function (DUF4326)
MILVVNKHSFNGTGEFVGRPSPLGNPYSHLPNSKAQFFVKNRDEAVKRYEHWLNERLKEDGPEKQELERLVKKYQDEGSLYLICYCAPNNCHGYILSKLIRNYNNLKND